MTSSSSPPPQLRCGLDTMILAYSLARVPRRVHQWLSHSHPQAAQDFWSRTGGGSHLP
jgi:hypothetical protein